MDYYKNNKVLSVKINSSDMFTTELISKVKGSSNTVYNQFIELNEDGSIDGTCSCPVSYNCKHVSAACIYYINQILKKNDSSKISKLLQWSQNLKSTIDSHKKLIQKDGYFLIYRFFYNMGYYDNEISFFKAKYLKNGNLGKGTKLDSKKVIEGHYNDILFKEDFEILKLLRPFYQYYHTEPISGPIGYSAIKSIIKTKRAFFQEDTKAVDFSNELFQTKFLVSKNKENYILKSNISSNYKLIDTQPPLVFDSDKNSFLNFDMDVALYRQILKAPSFSKNEMDDFFHIANELIPHVNIKPPKDTKTVKIKTKPIIYLYLDNFYLKVDFLYDQYSVKYHPQEKLTNLYKNGLVQIQRDLELEKEVFDTLESFGLNLEILNNDLISSLKDTDKKDQAKLEVWNNFLTTAIVELQNKGWKIVQDEGFDLKFSSNAQVQIEDEEDSNGWFNLSFDLKLDDISIPVATLVSTIIEQFESYENLPNYVNLEIEPNHFAKLKTSQIKPIINTILELYDKKQKDDRFKIAPHDTHLLGDFEKETFLGSKKLLELSKQLKNFDGIEEIKPPKALNATLRDYQQKGYNWLFFLHKYHFGGILADDMGLGKTIQTLSFLSKLKENTELQLPSLIIMPTSLIANWKNEAKKFTPNLSVLAFHGQNRKDDFDKINSFDIVLTTYALIVRDFEILSELKFKYIILDEAQKIKNPLTKMTKHIKALNSTHKLALSGTPVENHLGELWSIFDFLMPGFLDTKKFFKEFYQTPIEKENDTKKQELLNKKIKPFMLRRTKELVVKELPPKTQIIKYTQFEEKQSKLYESIRVTMEKKVKESIKNKGIGSSHIAILDALLKLRQTCCDPKLLSLKEATNVKESAKLELFLDLINELLSENRKILVFSQFTSMIAILEEKISKMNIAYAKLTGSTKNREKEIEKFTNGEVDIFFISLKAGGVGLNLTQADTVIHYDPWWNPAVENQATDRAYRIGQEKKVFVYKLIVENSIEQKILELQEKKQHLQNNLYEKDGQKDDLKFSNDELLELLK